MFGRKLGQIEHSYVLHVQGYMSRGQYFLWVAYGNNQTAFCPDLRVRK